ncbi:uncharacterized protein ATNIH1004_009235 [Aspergillus tanneri]|uniref:F-box domain-containing protein n=1 Tax=Aspergillus tanneri TaxID=1220188 RepID=A0A5M9MI60_9EURO|nr:uncharacterized protein ATNIH1004_009235 [Aspergillus tanneri]KAA8645024.1 hypothetical protein ATNIH1004_009235 [Aspergillus tanneri]
MAFTQLPIELLEQIITYTLPEGFESLALACKYLYTVCIPFLEHHNNLRWHFRDFRYCKTKWSFRVNQQLLRFPDTATSAYNLISRIAIEPIVGRYILEADFTGDSRLYSRFASTNREETTYEDRDKAVRQLFADSSYLRKAGIDWKEYYSAMMEDINNCCYSQQAAAFVLTLLPNLQRFRLPELWNPTPASEKLIATVIRIARQPTYNRASLSQVTKFEETRGSYNLSWATLLIALPRIQSFQGGGCIGKAYDVKSIESKYLCSEFNSTVETVGFWEASINAVAITDFLKHTPCLKSLTYWHSEKDSVKNQGWDLCEFISAVQRNVGSHLESLSTVTTELRCLISPGKPCLRSFQRLRRLELPLGIVICGLKAAELADYRSLDFNSLLGDLVPASVSQLSLFSPGKSPHDKALDLVFRDFATQKQLQTPNLTVIRLTCPDDADELYKAQCTNLAVETERAGVALEITETPVPISTIGIDDDKCFLEFS